MKAIEFLLLKYGSFGEKYWGRITQIAVATGNLEIVYMVNKVITSKPNSILAWAASNGRTNIIEWSERQGAKNWDQGLVLSVGGHHLEAIDWFIAKGANDWNSAFVKAAEFGYTDLMDFFECKGVTSHIKAMESAAKSGNIAVLDQLWG